MRTLARVVAVVGAIAVLAGCSVPSLHGIHTPDKSADDEGLVGTWVGKDVIAKIDRGEPGVFVVNAVLLEDEASKPARPTIFEARLVKLGEFRFMDLVLGKDGREGLTQQHNGLALRTHQFMKVQRDGDVLRAWSPSYDRLKSMVESGQGGLAFARLDDSEGGPELVLTSSTPELQKFFAAQGGNPELFTDPIVLHRQKSP
jgi:hypothetical protein